MDMKTQRDASRGRKSKAGGEKNQKRLKNIHPCSVRDPVRENLNSKGFEKKKHGHLPDFCTGDLKRL